MNTTETQTVITSEQVEILNSARMILREIANECGFTKIHREDSLVIWGKSMLGVKATAAEDAIFDAINCANSHLDLGLDEDQIILPRD